MTNEQDYPLTIEILEDAPSAADLNKGQICKARFDDDKDFEVFDDGAPSAPWMIGADEAKVI